DEDLVRAAPEVGIALAGREDPPEMAEGRDDVRLVERAHTAHDVAEMLGHALGVAREALGRDVLRPAAAVGEPAGRRKVMQRDDRLEPELEARAAHPAIV